MADVNFLMTAPVKPTRILLYAQIKASITSLLASFIMLIQIPLMIVYFGMKPSSIPLFLFAWFLMLIASSPINLAIFVLVFKYPILKTLFRIAFLVYCVALAFFCATKILPGSDAVLGLKTLVLSQELSYFPLVGWYFEIFKATVLGIHWLFFLDLGLILVTTCVSFLIIFRLVDTDFYEDAINTSEKLEVMKKAAKSGNTSLSAAFGLKSKKVKKVNYRFSKKGALAIFQKQLLELRKTGVYFFNLRTVLIVILDCLIAYAIPTEDEISLSIKILVALGVNMYFLLLTSNINSITKELDKPFIYLIPAKPFKKLIALTSIAALKNFSDSMIAMGLICIYFKASLLDAVLAALSMLVLSYTFNFMDLTASMLFGRVESGVLKTFFKMMMNMLLIIPSIIVIAIFLELGYSITLGFVVLLVTTATIGALLMIPATFSLKNPELNA